MTFLEEVLQDLHQRYPHSLQEGTILFPHKQALNYFYTTLNKGNLPKPQLYTLEEWLVKHSKLELASPLTLIKRLYKAFQAYFPFQESLDQFYGWGKLLLHEFDDLDRSLVDMSDVFSNLYQQKKIVANHELLTVEQQETIKSFWKTFGNKLSDQQAYFLEVTRSLPLIYQKWSTELLEAKIGYTGLCYKEAVNHFLKSNSTQLPPYLAFVGFNSLFQAEKKLITKLKEQRNVHLYWDLDAYYMEDLQQEAGYYLRQYAQSKLLQESFHKPYPNKIKGEPKTITYCGLNTVVAQVEEVLQEIKKEQIKTNQILIGLADEALLIPLLANWPVYFPPFLSTIGYPVIQTASYQLIEQWLTLHAAQQEIICPSEHLPTNLVIKLLHNPWVKNYDPTLVKNLLTTIEDQTIPHIPISQIPVEDLLYYILYTPLTNESNIKNRSAELFQLMYRHPLPESTTLRSPLLTENKAATFFQELFGQLLTDLPLASISSPSYLLKLFKQICKEQNLPFEEPKAETAIPIMRIEETTTLDFDAVFMIGMNEGYFPKISKESFIPYNLRKSYNLPTFDTFQTSNYAYAFYRLLQRSKKIFITYSTSTHAQGNKEISRYLQQLRYESNLPIQEKTIQNLIKKPTIQPIIIEKDTAIQAQLSNFISHQTSSSNSFTPTALATYLSCSLRFYFQYILGLEPEKKLTESMRFGNLFHKIIEKIYQPYLNKDLTKFSSNNLTNSAIKAKKIIQETFATYYQTNTSKKTGQQLIEETMMEKTVHQLIEFDKQQTNLTLLGLEQPLQHPLQLATGEQVMLKGIIDRIDLQGNTLRIIDYKTGKTCTTATIQDLFTKDPKKSNKAIFQLLYYAWLTKQKPTYNHYPIINPQLIPIHALFGAEPAPKLSLRTSADQPYQKVHDVTPYLAPFEKKLKELITSILDHQQPFIQTDEPTTCQTCPYKQICQK